MMEVFEFSGKGCRPKNQDYIKGCILNDEGTAVYVLADGMGGYEYGELAAKTTVESIIDFISINHNKMPIRKLLKEAFVFANDSLSIKRMALNAKEMGCVVAVLFLVNNTAYMAWIGDSRIYFFRNEKLAFRTTDHSLVEELSKVRSLTASDLEKYSAIVTRAVMGVNEDISPDLMKTETNTGDVFILCTDGLHKQLNIADMAKFDSIHLHNYLCEVESQMEDNYSIIRLKI